MLIARQNKRSFSLVELLIVIVVIGILTALATANHTAQKRRLEYANALMNVRAISHAVRTHLYGEGSVISTNNTTHTEDTYKVSLPEGTFSNYTVFPAGTVFRIQAFYNADGNSAIDSETTVFVWRPDGTVDSCGGNTDHCGIAS